jgi:hypothetical protein
VLMASMTPMHHPPPPPGSGGCAGCRKRDDVPHKKWRASFLSNGAEPVYDAWLGEGSSPINRLILHTGHGKHVLE